MKVSKINDQPSKLSHEQLDYVIGGTIKGEGIKPIAIEPLLAYGRNGQLIDIEKWMDWNLSQAGVTPNPL